MIRLNESSTIYATAVAFMIAVALSAFGCSRMRPAREYEWDFRKEHTVGSLPNDPSEAARYHRSFAGPIHLTLYLPGNILVAEVVHEIRVETYGDHITDLYLTSDDGPLDDAYRHGLELLQKYHSPSSISEELTQWYATVSHMGPVRNYFQLWDEGDVRLGIELQTSDESGQRWNCSLVIGFTVANSTDCANVDAISYLNNLEMDWKVRIKSSRRVNDAADRQSRESASDQELMALLMEEYKTSQSRRRIVDVLRCDQANGFGNVVLGDILYVLARARDREGLVRLFAVRYPRVSKPGIIESMIVNQPGFTDGLLVFCDAFDVSSDAAVRKQIADGLRLALGPLGIDSSDDSGMVKASREWFMSHAKRYKPNPYYDPDDGGVDASGRSLHTGLFVPRADPAPRRSVRK